MIYEFNYGAEQIAARLIPEYHTRLRGVKIAYLFKGDMEAPPPIKRLRDGKKFTWAKASRVSDKWRALADAEYQFVIEFDAHVWNGLGPDKREALVDHELCHCGVDADGYYMRQHDLEEFREIVARHGFWKDDVRMFAEATLPLLDKLPVE